MRVETVTEHSVISCYCQ